MKDKKPLAEWLCEFTMRKELHLSTNDLETMDIEKYVFFKSLINEIREYEGQLQKEYEEKLKDEQRKIRRK